MATKQSRPSSAQTTPLTQGQSIARTSATTTATSQTELLVWYLANNG
jgi:hypothetical protein